MGSLKVGSSAVADVRYGSTMVSSIRRGSTIMWQRTGGGSGSLIFDDFDRADADTLGSNWTYEDGAFHDHEIGVENGQARVKIPEGLIGGFFTLSTSRCRYNVATASSDDGFVETQPSSLGSSASGAAPTGYRTQIFGRASTDCSNGVGIEMRAGNCWIIRRVSEVGTRMASGGAFQPGDVLRLTYATDLYTLTKNGRTIATWNDSGQTAHRGASYRSLMLRGDGAKDLLGPRRFSPALNYALMG